MAKRSPSRHPTSSTNKTLMGAIVALVLAALTGLGIKLSGWLTGKTPTTPTERPTITRPAGTTQHRLKLRDRQEMAV